MLKMPEIYHKKPWIKTFYGIRSRCSDSKNRYCRRGIKCLITVEELKELWERDRGYKLKEPSIDRINNDGNYEYSNCRFIERRENSRLANLGRKLNQNALNAIRKVIKRVNKTDCRYSYKQKVTDGITVYASMIEASKVNGVTVSAISHCCRGRTKYCNGKKWKYIGKLRKW